MEDARSNDSFLLKESLPVFAVTGATDVHMIQSGSSSVVYRIADETTRRSYALHILQVHNNYRFVNEMAVYEVLRGSSLNVAGLLPAKDGKPYYAIGDQFITLAPWMPGMHPIPGAIKDTIYERLGGSLATFHNTVKKLPHPNSHQLLTEDLLEWQVNHSTLLSDNTAARLWKVTRALEGNSLSRGIVHGDFHSGNLLIHDSTITVIDMERVGQGVLLYDVARAAIDLCSIGELFDIRANRLFLNGYAKVRPMEEEDLLLYSAAIAYASLSVASWFMEKDRHTEAQHYLSIGHSATELLRDDPTGRRR